MSATRLSHDCRDRRSAMEEEPVNTMRALRETRSIMAPAGGERGDVPGWVLITVMTAGLVMLLWGLAVPALTNLFNQAMSSVSGI